MTRVIEIDQGLLTNSMTRVIEIDQGLLTISMTRVIEIDQGLLTNSMTRVIEIVKLLSIKSGIIYRAGPFLVLAGTLTEYLQAPKAVPIS